MPKRVMQGVVVSDKMDKTVVVKVERRVMDPLYKKYVRKSKRYSAHDADNSFKVGDVVKIRECKPISKRKTWEVIGDEGGDTVTAAAPVASTATPASEDQAT